MQLIENLGLEKDVITAAPAAKRRYIYDEGKLELVPSTIWVFLRSPLMRGVLPALLQEWRMPPCNASDESILTFISRRLSPAIAARLIDPLISGIYAGDISKLSVRACFPSLALLEQTHGSLSRAMLHKAFRRSPPKSPVPDSTFISSIRQQPLFTLRHGLEGLISALAEQFREELKLECGAASVHLQPSGVAVQMTDGKMHEADQVFLALPAHAAAQILKPERIL